MNEPPKGLARITDFAGMISDLDPDDLPTNAAQVQLNCGTIRPGELTTRGGLREVTFDTLT